MAIGVESTMLIVPIPACCSHALPVQVNSCPLLVLIHCWPIKAPDPAGDAAATTAAEPSPSFAAVTASSRILLVVTASVAIAASVTALAVMAVANVPVPVPVTGPVRVMV